MDGRPPIDGFYFGTQRRYLHAPGTLHAAVVVVVNRSYCPAAYDPNGSRKLLGFRYIPIALPPTAIFRKAMGRPAVKVRPLSVLQRLSLPSPLLLLLHTGMLYRQARWLFPPHGGTGVCV